MAKNKNHHLMKRGKVWYLQKKGKGKWLKKALSESLVEARRMRDQLLEEVRLHGDVNKAETVANDTLFGEVALKWVKIKGGKVKASTLRDYKSSMNYYLLPRFGNTPVARIGYLDIEEFISELDCSNKRINNVLVPMRSLMMFAHRAGYIDNNPLLLVANLTVEKPDIHPLSMEEITLILEKVSPRYKNFFRVAFFTGLRFGEMSALKWKNVDFKRGIVKIRETRVRGEEGRPKTKRSVRDIEMLLPVVEALRDQRTATMGRSDYVFLNQYNRPLLPDSVNSHVWKPALKKAGLVPRSLYQTRHTFATLMLDAGELPGWVQKMMGHETLQMIMDRYYSFIKNYQRDDGSAFMENVYHPSMKVEIEASSSEENIEKLPQSYPKRRTGN
ncbi:tyrosine-type recombinase/integrase [Thermodesulfobacteriota bacterium]